MVLTCLQFGHSFGIDIKADYGVFFTKLDRQRQTDVTEADHCNGKIERVVLHIFLVVINRKAGI